MKAEQVRSEPGAARAGYFMDPELLWEKARELHDGYATADPFPHVVMEGLFPDDVLTPVLETFPRPDDIDWQRFENPNEKKLASRSEIQLSDAARRLIWELNSQAFLNFLEILTGIEGLIPDPYLVGGGLHQIQRGGLLKIHADFNRHSSLRLDRRLNLLVYLNRDWKEEYGGHLELWDRGMTHCVRKVLPVFNRSVLFSTTDDAYHGHPQPLTCPEGWTRKSLALYYYTAGRPTDEASKDHSTLFQRRPGERVAKTSRMRTLIKDLVPPVFVKLARRLRARP